MFVPRGGGGEKERHAHIPVLVRLCGLGEMESAREANAFGTPTQAMGVAIGSSIQIALFVTPLMVMIGWAIGEPMSLHFETCKQIVVPLRRHLEILFLRKGLRRFFYANGEISKSLDGCVRVLGLGRHVYRAGREIELSRRRYGKSSRPHLVSSLFFSLLEVSEF